MSHGKKHQQTRIQWEYWSNYFISPIYATSWNFKLSPDFYCRSIIVPVLIATATSPLRQGGRERERQKGRGGGDRNRSGNKGKRMTKPDTLCSCCAQPGEYCMGRCAVINVRPCKVLDPVAALQVYTLAKNTRPMTFNKPQSLRYSRTTSEKPLRGQLSLATLN